MTIVQPARSDTASPPPVSEGRYLDALLTDMDRYLRPDLSSDRARFLYQAVRRVLVRFIAESSHRPAFNETGFTAAPDWAEMAPDAALNLEGTLLDAEIAWGDERVARLATAPHTPPVTIEAVEGALRHLGYPDATVETMRVIIGGRSKQTILLRASLCQGLPPDLVVRRDLLVGSLGTSVVNEFGLLQALHTHGVEVPEVYHLEADRDVLGTPVPAIARGPWRCAGAAYRGAAFACKGARRSTRPGERASRFRWQSLRRCSPI